MSDLMLMFFFVGVAITAVAVMRYVRSTSQASSTGTSTGSSSSSNSSKPLTASQQIAEDIRLTQTLDMVDAIQIMDELRETTQNFRQYCELVGTSMPNGGITAPYSQRQVAYYDVKCYRIDRERGRDIETLVAHETSPDAFWFNDGTCEDRVYIDLTTFGNNVILVNSANHIEGPDSDFSKAFAKKASAARTSSTGGAYAMVGGLVARGAGAVLEAGRSLRNPFKPRWSPQLALVGGGTAGVEDAQSFGSAPAKVYFASSGEQSKRPHPRPNSGTSRPNTPRPQANTHNPYAGHPHPHSQGGMPGGLGDFLGTSYGSPWVMGGGIGYGYPPNHHRPTSSADTAAGMILGMGLGALLSSLNETTVSTTGNSGSSFRGYRIVENVVPLASPIYCIGEIYRVGKDIHMGASHAKDYTTSYFATKPESEVLSALGAK